MSCEDCKQILEEMKTLINKFNAMNSHYASALSKTLITKDELKTIFEYIAAIKTKEVLEKKEAKKKKALKKKVIRKKK